MFNTELSPKRYWRRQRSQEVQWDKREAILYTVTTAVIPALRWAAMRAVLCFITCEGQGHKKVSIDHIHNF